MRQFSFISTTILIILLTGCASISIADKNIDKLEINLSARGNTSVSSVIPGSEYIVKLKVISGGQEIKYPDYTDFTITSPDETFSIVKQTQRGLKIKVHEDVLYLISRESLSISISVKRNSFPVSSHSYSFDFNKPNILNYSGVQGIIGKKGTDGKNRSTILENGLRGGGPGNDGLQGSHGENGNDVTLLATFYDISNVSNRNSDSRLLCFYNLKTKEITLRTLHEITIESSGGKGGIGGEGGRGGSGTSLYSVTDGSKKKLFDGDGGDGGDGGNGGNGGNIQILFSNDAILNYITPNTKGGLRGKPGSGGSGKTNGKQGKHGISGKNGSFSTKLISHSQILKLIENENPYFDIGKIMFE